LLGGASFVDDGLRRSNVLLRIGLIPTSGSYASLRVLPTKPPKVLASRFDVGFAIARWLQRADCDGSLEKFFCPEIEPRERQKADVEGWILGVL
jgi:hypothetical protein